MKEITATMVKELRERTGVGMGKCKEALVSAEGDIEKAIDILRKAGMAAAGKKEGRETKEGFVALEQDASHIALLLASAETDFVVNNDRFKEFVADCIRQALKDKPASIEALMAMPYQKDKSLTLEQYRNLVIQALGENIQLPRFELIEKKANASYGIYSHMGGKLLVVVELIGAPGQEDVAREIAMHVAAENPDYVNPQEVPADVIAREEEIARSQVQGKPENIVGKIVEGKVKAFMDQFCLVCQKYIKDNSLTVAEYINSCSKKLDKPMSIGRFWRWKVGQ